MVAGAVIKAQYEMFYAGALYGTKGHSARTYDWGNARHLVQAVLDRYQLNDVI